METVFSLFPVTKVTFNNLSRYLNISSHGRLQKKETILVESYASIKHLQTRTWLHLDKGIVFQRSKACSVTDLAKLELAENTVAWIQAWTSGGSFSQIQLKNNVRLHQVVFEVPISI